MRLSVCLIVRNEERVLERCLKCASRIADDLVVVDTGSTDRSPEIAGMYTSRVFFHQWQDSFAEARNYAASQALCEYVMWMDADDVIEEMDIEAINRLKSEITLDTDAVFMLYSNGTGYFHDYLLRDRILRKEYSTRNKGDAHENVTIELSWKLLLRPDIQIVHKKEYINDPDRNIHIFDKAIASGKELNNHDRVYYCRELWAHGFYDDSYEEYRKLNPFECRPESYYYALVFAVKSLLASDRAEECLRVIQDALVFVEPTAYMLCQMAIAYEKLSDTENARKLYLQAMNTPEKPETFYIQFTGYTDYIPCVRLARLYYRAGDMKAAHSCNETAAKIYPQGSEWMLNRILMMNVSEAGRFSAKEADNGFSI